MKILPQVMKQERSEKPSPLPELVIVSTVVRPDLRQVQFEEQVDHVPPLMMMRTTATAGVKNPRTVRWRTCCVGSRGM